MGKHLWATVHMFAAAPALWAFALAAGCDLGPPRREGSAGLGIVLIVLFVAGLFQRRHQSRRRL